MEFKPVHIVTNDDLFVLKLLHFDLEFEYGAEDYTEEEGLHYHYLVRWPVAASRRLSPTRQGAVKRWRKDGCHNCKGQGYNSKCKVCGRYYKLIWCAGPEHTDNTRRYIQRKIEADPTRDVRYIPEETED